MMTWLAVKYFHFLPPGESATLSSDIYRAKIRLDQTKPKMSKPLSKLDFTCCCRICLREDSLKSEMHELFTETIPVPLSKKIVLCASVEIVKGDGLPEQVCEECCKKIDESCEFRKLIESSDLKLRELLKLNENPEKFENVSLRESLPPSSPQQHVNEPDVNDPPNPDSQPPVYPCSICNKFYKTLDSLRTHKKIHTAKSLKCPKCDKVFAYRRLLTQHKLVHLDKTFHCQVCNKYFKTKSQLTIHSRRHVNERPFQCGHCDKKFFQLSHRNQHQRLHTNERPYTCEICDKSFRNQSGLLGHKMQKHSNMQPYQCSICSKKFSLKTSLKNHFNLHSGKPFVCECCGQTFALSSSLKTHLKIHSDLNVNVCSICGKKFSKSFHLEEHIRTHENKRDFVCSICGKSFKQSAGLMMHMKTHNLEQNYQCSWCNKFFNSGQSLDIHCMEHSELEDNN